MPNNIHIIKGNLFDTDADVIAHQVNCQGVMGSGVAKSVRLLYPQAYNEYLKFCSFHESNEEKLSLLGQIQVVKCDDNEEKNIVNMFAQENYGHDGRFTNYEAFYNCLEKLNMVFEFKYSIAFPYNIGCDRGGADWDIIFMMMQKVFKNRQIYIYKLEENKNGKN